MNTVTLSHGRGWLAPEAAASLARVDAQLERPIDINEAGRTRARQQYHWDRYQAYLAGGPWAPIALHPDDPNARHLTGLAIDTDDWTQPGVVELLRDHGWIRTVYRWVNGVWTLVEPWHFEYRLQLDNHRHIIAAPAALTPAPTNGDLVKILRNTLNGDVFIVGPLRLKHLGTMADVRAAERTFGKTIDLDDNAFRIALIGFNVPYAQAVKHADWQG